ncbi:MAG: flippase-like domain-containing protein [Flavobacteriaceae bacterium]|nr:flippase-like domain-containing protein [Flavobacteriaceae bacterium]
MNKSLKKTIQYSSILAIGGAFLWFVFAGTDWTELWSKIINANYYWISLGMAIGIVSHYLRGLRAVLLYEPMGFKVPVKHSFYAVLIGYFINYIIPRAGELSRCASLYKTDDIPVNKSLGTVVAERAFDLLLLVLILSFITLSQLDLINKVITKLGGETESVTEPRNFYLSIKFMLLVFVVVTGSVFLLFRKRLLAVPLVQKVLVLAKGFWEGIMTVRKVSKPSLFWIYSSGIWLGYLMMMYCCLKGMDATNQLGIMACATVFALGCVGIVIPAPAAGAGTYHYFIILALSMYDIPREDALAYATLVHGAQMILLIGLGAVSSVMVLLVQRKKITA